MSNETALKQEIRSSAEAKVSELLTNARNKADSIVAEAEAEALHIRDRKEFEATKRLEQMERSEMAKARMECSKTKLTMQSKYVERAFDEAYAEVTSLPKRDPQMYKRVLANYVSEALHHLMGNANHLVAIVRADDKQIVEAILEKLDVKGSPSVSISDESLYAAGGILLRSDNSRVYFVNTFESRFLISKEELRAEVVSALLKK
jgi:vacuolar-type H+-ATPase subunit E/Vma4